MLEKIMKVSLVMDEFLRDIYCTLFKRWILFQKIDFCSIELVAENHILIQDDKYQGDVYFHTMGIIELKVRNLFLNKDEFYLHFQMNNLKHAVGLFYEMEECFEHDKHKKLIKVLLCCSGGLTTSYFSLVINEEEINTNIHVDAISYSDIYQNIDNYDIVFLAPQISYLLSHIKSYNKAIPVLAIPAQIFAKYDVKSFIDLVIKELDRKDTDGKISIDFKKTRIRKSVLCISIFKDRQRIHILYRVYNQFQNKTLENEIIKLNITIHDICDIIHYVIAVYKELDIIGISTPGFITKKGMLVSTYLSGLDNCYIYDFLHKQFCQDIYVYNDVNSAAAGYYASQDQYENIAFIFQPVNHYPGAGIVVNGQLIKGHRNLAGEIQYSSRHLMKEYFSDNKTHQEILNILMNDILTIVSVVDSDIILIYSELIDSVAELERELSRVLYEQTPILKKIKCIDEYILIGLLHLCLN